MRTRWIISMAGLCLLVLGGCSRASEQQPAVAVELRVSPEPLALGPATVTVTLVDEAKRPIQGADVVIEGTMSHAGMASVNTQTREVAPGRYEGAFEFAMSGDWVMIVHATLPDGQTIEREIPLGAIALGHAERT